MWLTTAIVSRGSNSIDARTDESISRRNHARSCCLQNVLRGHHDVKWTSLKNNELFFVKSLNFCYFEAWKPVEVDVWEVSADCEPVASPPPATEDKYCTFNLLSVKLSKLSFPTMLMPDINCNIYLNWKTSSSYSLNQIDFNSPVWSCALGLQEFGMGRHRPGSFESHGR